MHWRDIHDRGVMHQQLTIYVRERERGRSRMWKEMSFAKAGNT